MVDTLELSALTSYLSATRKELFAKLTPYEWEDVVELVTQDYTHKNEIEHLQDEWVEAGYNECKQDMEYDLEHEYDRGYDAGYAQGYEEARQEYVRIEE